MHYFHFLALVTRPSVALSSATQRAMMQSIYLFFDFIYLFFNSIYLLQVRLALREQLSNAIQCASFTLLRDLENSLKWDSIKLATYQREFKGLRLNLWVAVPLPTRKPKPVEPER